MTIIPAILKAEVGLRSKTNLEKVSARTYLKNKKAKGLGVWFKWQSTEPLSLIPSMIDRC
jgi:hypothetical protein